MTANTQTLTLKVDTKEIMDHVNNLLAMHEPTLRVIAVVADERARQIEKGYDKDNDDAKPGTNWAHLVQREAHYAAQASIGDHDKHGFRQRMVRVAALAIAAIESYDRADAAVQEQVDMQSHTNGASDE